MALILDPRSYDRATLVALANEFLLELTEIRSMTVSPRGRVLDPASLDTARELVDAVLGSLHRAGERSPAELATEVNLAYATTIAALDLVKSHTDVPRVPAPRKGPTTP
jgi:hypothetical protein